MNPLKEVRTITTLASRLRSHHADVYFGYTIKPVLYGPIAATIARVPMRCVMVSGVGYTFLGQERWQRRLLSQAVRSMYRVALSLCQVVFFQNPDDLAEFEAHNLLPRHAKRVIVNGSGVDLDAYDCRPLPTGPPLVLYAGRLLRDKGILELVEAARIVRATRPEVRFQLLGYLDPNPASITRAQVDAWVHEGLVEYLGETSDVRPYLTAATALVLPSHREGTPRSVLEALAMGRPVVVTDVPGCRETVVDGENGYLVPVRDPRALAAGILRLLSDDDKLRQMATCARALAERKYDARHVSAAMLDAMELG